MDDYEKSVPHMEQRWSKASQFVDFLHHAHPESMYHITDNYYRCMYIFSYTLYKYEYYKTEIVRCPKPENFQKTLNLI